MITDNTAKWNVKKITDFGSTPGIPIGFEFFTFNPNLPEGFLPLLGGEFNRELYPALWSLVQEQSNRLISETEWQAMATANDGNVSFYSTGDGSTTFRVPSITGWVKGANNMSEVGSYLKAGLPNITGEVLATADVNAYENAIEDSAVFGTNQASRKTLSASYTDYNLYSTLGFDASRSNPIYGRSDTVQPPSIVGMWVVKAYGSITNIENQDLTEISDAFSKVVTVKVWG